MGYILQQCTDLCKENPISSQGKFHSYNTELASQYGDREATLITYFTFWIKRNRQRGKNHQDGRWWTFDTVDKIAEIYPQWTRREVRYRLESLVNQGVLIKGNYNKTRYDRTLWYAFADEVKFIGSKDISPIHENTSSIGQNCPIKKTELSNQKDRIVQPIPVSNPVGNPDAKRDAREDHMHKDPKTTESSKNILAPLFEGLALHTRARGHYSDGQWQPSRNDPPRTSSRSQLANKRALSKTVMANHELAERLRRRGTEVTIEIRDDLVYFTGLEQGEFLEGDSEFAKIATGLLDSCLEKREIVSDIAMTASLREVNDGS